MKRTLKKSKRESQLERRLELVRTTVRVLTPTELEQIAGGTEESGTREDPNWTGCCLWPFTG